MSKLSVAHAVPRDDLLLGVVRVEPVAGADAPGGFDSELAAALAANAPLETVRLTVRNLLRNGSYRPTGRAKPASEYLLRSANEGTFPRINPLVDAANLASLRWALPISLWDLDLAGLPAVRFRLGRAGERFVFNPAGQVIEVEDLVVGCRGREAESEPFLSPVKDCLATRTGPATRRVGACVYVPAGLGQSAARAFAAELAGALAATSSAAKPQPEQGWAVLGRGEDATI